MGARNWVSMLCLSEAIGHKLYDRLLQCAATAQTQRWIAAECGREGLLENSKDGGLKHLTTTLTFVLSYSKPARALKRPLINKANLHPKPRHKPTNIVTAIQASIQFVVHSPAG